MLNSSGSETEMQTAYFSEALGEDSEGTNAFYSRLTEALGCFTVPGGASEEELLEAVRETVRQVVDGDMMRKKHSEELIDAKARAIELSKRVEALEEQNRRWEELMSVYRSSHCFGDLHSVESDIVDPASVTQWFIGRSERVDCLQANIVELESAMLVLERNHLLSSTHSHETIMELNTQNERMSHLLDSIAIGLNYFEGSTSSLPDTARTHQNQIIVLSDAVAHLLSIHGDYSQITKTYRNLGSIVFDESSSSSYIRKLLEEDSNTRSHSSSSSCESKHSVSAVSETLITAAPPCPSNGFLIPETEQIITKLCTDHYRLLSAEATIRKYTPEVIRLRRKIPILTTEANSLRQQLNNVKVLRSQSESRLKNMIQEREENLRRANVRDVSLRSDFEDKYDREVRRHLITQNAMKEMEEQMDRLQQHLDEQIHQLQDKEEECINSRHEYETVNRQFRKEQSEKEVIAQSLRDSQKMEADYVFDLERARSEIGLLEAELSNQVDQLRYSESACDLQKIQLIVLSESRSMSAEDWMSARCREEEWRRGMKKLLEIKAFELDERSRELTIVQINSNEVQQEFQRNAYELDDLRKQLIQLEHEKMIAKQCCSIA